MPQVHDNIGAYRVRTVAIFFSLTADSAKVIGAARRFRTERPQRVPSLEDVERGLLRLRIIVPQNLYGMHASYEALDEIGERSWVTLPRDGAVDFAGVTVDEATVLALALQRLGAFAYNNAGDGNPIIKYDLGMV